MLHDDKASINKKVGLRIKEARKSRGLTLAELGNKIGLSESNTQRYESGRISSVSVELINKIAKALNVSPAFLMGWEENMITNNSGNSYSNLNQTVTTLPQVTSPQPKTRLAVALQRLAQNIDTGKVNLNNAQEQLIINTIKVVDPEEDYPDDENLD